MITPEARKKSNSVLRTPRRMKEAAKIAVENPSMTKRAILKKAGYPDTTAVNPKQVFEAKGFLAELESYGLTNELITSSLVEDIKHKPKNRVRELDLAARMKRLVGTDISNKDFQPVAITIQQLNIVNGAEVPKLLEPDNDKMA